MSNFEQKTSAENIHTIANKLKCLMKQYENISPTELARRTDIPQPTLHRLLSGETEDPRISTLNIIAQFFKVRVDYFLNSVPASLYHSPVQHVPLLQWKEVSIYEQILKSVQHNVWQGKWVQTDVNVSEKSFALLGKKSTETVFPIGASLVVDPVAEIADGDLVLVLDVFSKQATIRELIMDGPDKIFYPLNKGLNLPPIPMSKKIVILGSLIQTKFTYKQ